MAIAVVVVVDILATHTTTDEMVSVQIDTIETLCCFYFHCLNCWIPKNVRGIPIRCYNPYY